MGGAGKNAATSPKSPVILSSALGSRGAAGLGVAGGCSVVDDEAVHGGLLVGVAGQAVPAGGLESAVAGEFGDEDDVVAGADERWRTR